MCKCPLIDCPRETGINSEYKVENYAIAYEIPFECDLTEILAVIIALMISIS